MARVRIVKRAAGWLEPGTIVETPGPVTADIHAWLLAGDAELLVERVERADRPDDDGQVPPWPPRRR
jgi:hypothetical protein